MAKLLLIDGNSLLYRAYYGTAYSAQGILKNSSGFPVNAIMTFTRMIWKAFEEQKPDYVLVAFDAGKKTKRHDKLPTYKEGRQKTPMELIVQIDKVKKMLDLMQIAQFELVEVEADDIIGSLARKYQKEYQVSIISSDKDMLQLVNEHVDLAMPQNGRHESKLINYQNFEATFGHGPQQIIDLKALAGDSSDNLKGVNGIGAKGALKLIQEYHSLANIYANIQNLSPGLQKKLNADKEMAFLCQELATIDCNVKIPLELKQLEFSNQIRPELIQFYHDLEINSLVKMFTLKLNENATKNLEDFSNLAL